MDYNTNVGGIFGARNEREKWFRHLQDGALVTPFPSETYTKVPVSWHDAFYNINSNIECIPHLLQWGEDKVEHKGCVLNWVVKKTLVPYLSNMNDDELAAIDPMLTFVYAFGKVLRIQCFAASVELCIEINGVQRTLLINVMNMMEYFGESNNELQDYKIRWTLN